MHKKHFRLLNKNDFLNDPETMQKAARQSWKDGEISEASYFLLRLLKIEKRKRPP